MEQQNRTLTKTKTVEALDLRRPVEHVPITNTTFASITFHEGTTFGLTIWGQVDSTGGGGATLNLEVNSSGDPESGEGWREQLIFQMEDGFLMEGLSGICVDVHDLFWYDARFFEAISAYATEMAKLVIVYTHFGVSSLTEPTVEISLTVRGVTYTKDVSPLAFGPHLHSVDDRGGDQTLFPDYRQNIRQAVSSMSAAGYTGEQIALALQKGALDMEDVRTAMADEGYCSRSTELSTIMVAEKPGGEPVTVVDWPVVP